MRTVRVLVAGALLLGVLGFAAGRVSAQAPGNPADGTKVPPNVRIWNTQDFVIGMGDVDGAPLRRLSVQRGSTTCYFWKDSMSCVRE